jgi:hypothetical protein
VGGVGGEWFSWGQIGSRASPSLHPYFPSHYVQEKAIKGSVIEPYVYPVLAVIELSKRSDLPDSCFHDSQVFFWNGGAQSFWDPQLSTILESPLELWYIVTDFVNVTIHSQYDKKKKKKQTSKNPTKSYKITELKIYHLHL